MVHFPLKLAYEDLELYTDGFSEKNFIGRTQFGKAYHGRIPSGSHGMEAQDVTVKIWEETNTYYRVYGGENRNRLRDEVNVLGHPSYSHPNLVKVIGYCCIGERFEDNEIDTKLGIVYELKSMDTVHNLTLKGIYSDGTSLWSDGFTWLQRMKVAIGFARLLKFLHDPKGLRPPSLVFNLDAAHIMLDQDYNPKLIDCGMMSGGVLRDKTKDTTHWVFGCYGYMDPYGFAIAAEERDVFAFGVILLGLIAKRIYDPEGAYLDSAPFVYKWAWREYKRNKSALPFGRPGSGLVHENLLVDPDFDYSDGSKITKLAMKCVNYYYYKRPTMKQVLQCLLNLRVVRRHAEMLGVADVLKEQSIWKSMFRGRKGCLS